MSKANILNYLASFRKSGTISRNNLTISLSNIFYCWEPLLLKKEIKKKYDVNG